MNLPNTWLARELGMGAEEEIEANMAIPFPVAGVLQNV
jgi:hypothetical protein